MPGAPGGKNRAGNATQRLLRNSFFNSSSWAINSAVQLLMIPLLVRHLGLDGYGIYILLVNNHTDLYRDLHTLVSTIDPCKFHIDISSVGSCQFLISQRIIGYVKRKYSESTSAYSL